MTYVHILPYVIHNHETANRSGNHWDLRIKYPDRRMLADWSIPKAKFPDEGEKLLAVKGMDHGFYWLHVDNMVIPKGDVGAGTIKIIQKGTLSVEGWSPRHITFYIEGPKVTGRYTLIRFKAKEKNTDTWALMKTKVQIK